MLVKFRLSIYTMEKLHAFIKLVDANYFGKQKEQELIQLYESLLTIPAAATTTPIVQTPPVVTTTGKSTCQFIMKNGARKGEMCGKGCMKGNSLCSLHKEKPVQEVKKDTSEEKQVIDLTVTNIVSGEKSESITIENKESIPKEKNESIPKEKNESIPKEKKESIPKEKKESIPKEKKESIPKEKKETVPKEKKEAIPKKEKVMKEKKETVGEPCPNIVKTGDRIGTVCGNTTKSCPHHQPIHIRKSGDWSVLTGTNVLFDKKKQVVIGYLADEKQVFEENDEVRKVCSTYDLLYAKM